MVRRTFVGCLLALVCISFSGCGDSADSLTNELLSMMENIVTDLESGVPPEKIQAKYEAKSKNLKARMAKVPDPSPEKQKAILEKIFAKAQSLQPRIQAAMQKHKFQTMPNLGF